MDSIFDLMFAIMNIYMQGQEPVPERKDGLSDLPVEIFLIITEFLNNRDMCSLSVVSPYYSRATQLLRDSRKQEQIFANWFRIRLSRNWIRSRWPAMIVCCDGTFERDDFPQFVQNHIRERWINIQNDGTGRIAPTYRNPAYMVCDRCRRKYTSVSLAIVDTETVCWDCAH